MAISLREAKFGSLISSMRNLAKWSAPDVAYVKGVEGIKSTIGVVQTRPKTYNVFVMGINRWGDPDFKVGP